MSGDRRYLTAKQAAAALGVSLPTLYAYTSRGQLQSEPAPGRSRERRYYLDDVDRLRERKETRRDPSLAAARGMHWGSPVLASGITLIESGRVYYRGQDVVKLAETASLEQVAALLWGAEEPARADEALSSPQLTRLKALSKDPLARLQMALPLAAAADPASHDLRPAAVRRTGARILRLWTAIVAGRPFGEAGHLALAAAWVGDPDAIRAALVVCADHELNVSAFTARCAASAGASPYDTVAAALATLKGRRHGGETERVAALFDEGGPPRTVVVNRLRRGENLPGFGHPLYPAGDPRAALLMRLAETGGNRAAWKRARGLATAAAELLHEPPNLDFGLVALSRTHGFPGQAPMLLFALGRTVGWIAHAIEQYATEQLIRPRARYTGPAPGTPAIF